MVERVNGTATREPDRWSRTGFETPRHSTADGGGSVGSLIGGFVRRALTLGGWGIGPGGAGVAQLLSSLRGDKEITRPFWQHPWIHSCTARIADNAAEARIKFWRDRSEDADEVPEEDPIHELFRRPHPALPYTRWLRNSTIWHWHWGDQVWALRAGVGREDDKGRSAQDWIDDPNRLAGAKFQAMLRLPREKRLQLLPLKPTTVQEVKGDSGMIEGWKLNTSTGQIDIPIEATSHIFSPDPYDPEFLRGLGRISAILRVAQIDFAAEQYIEAQVSNGGVPNIVVVGKHGFTDAQAKAISKRIKEEHQDPTKAGKAMAIGGNDIELLFPGISPKDMEWGRLRFWDRETIISVLGASPAFLGITENVQRGNAEESRKSVWQDTISPWLEILATEIQNEFLPRLPEPWASYGVSFDTSHIKALQESEDARIDRAVKIYTQLPVSFGEAAELAGWDIPEDMAGRDERYAQATADDTTSLRPSDPQVDPEEDERGLVLAQAIKQLDLLEFEPFRAAAAKAFRDQTQTFEQQIKKVARRIFEGYVQASIRMATDLAAEGKPVTQGMSKRDFSPDNLEALFPDIFNWQEKLGGQVGRIEARIYEVHAKLMADALGAAQLSSAADFEAASLLASHEVAVKETLVTLRTALKDTLLRNLTGGPGVGTLADQLREVLESYRADLKVMQDSLGTRAQLIARTECLLPETLVDRAVVRAAFRRSYVGEVVNIKTRGGRKLTTTPNHPMLTQRGWIAAGALDEGDYLVCDGRQQDASATRDKNIDRGPAPICEIFDALAAVGIVERRATRQPDFHGDGLDGEVDILCPDRPLRVGRFSALNKPLLQQILSPPAMIGTGFCGACGALLGSEHADSFRSSAPRNAHPGELAYDATPRYSEIARDRASRFATDVAISDSVGRHVKVVVGATATIEEYATGIAQGPACDACLAQGAENRLLGRAKARGDEGLAQAGFIEFDRVATLRRREYQGHVYNIASPHGYFNASGAFTGNTTSVANNARMNEAKAQGVQEMRWISARDGNVRDSHRQLDGERRDVGEVFGFGLKFPGDPDADVSEVVNCRCSLAATSKGL